MLSILGLEDERLRIQHAVDVNIKKHKAIFVAQEIDYVETFSRLKKFFMGLSYYSRIDNYLRELTCEFEMKDLGLMHCFLGLEV